MLLHSSSLVVKIKRKTKQNNKTTSRYLRGSDFWREESRKSTQFVLQANRPARDQ